MCIALQAAKSTEIKLVALLNRHQYWQSIIESRTHQLHDMRDALS